MQRDIIVRDVGPRDGLQLVKKVLPTEIKMAWIKADIAAGVPEIETCSYVPPHVIAQFADAVEVSSQAARLEGAEMSALTPNLKGAQIGFKTGIGKINYVMSVSETHNQQNVRRTKEDPPS
ncbi:MAG: hydroxymethylglutaryl-CoA lyase, partial [Pseudomonadota bacterium]